MDSTRGTSIWWKSVRTPWQLKRINSRNVPFLTARVPDLKRAYCLQLNLEMKMILDENYHIKCHKQYNKTKHLRTVQRQILKCIPFYT